MLGRITPWQARLSDDFDVNAVRGWNRYRSGRIDAPHESNWHQRRVAGIDGCAAFLMPLSRPFGRRRRHCSASRAPGIRPPL